VGVGVSLSVEFCVFVLFFVSSMCRASLAGAFVL
jgi:hypothetical protein